MAAAVHPIPALRVAVAARPALTGLPVQLAVVAVATRRVGRLSKRHSKMVVRLVRVTNDEFNWAGHWRLAFFLIPG